ncbi:MAG TPA: hypothetical protein VKB78_12845 [Pirellulales bacterium]|nr:hypothetical protein [Pirellulales bacterium]
MARGIFGGFIAVILGAIAALAWNSYSNGGLIHAVGGVTSQELIAEAAKHPGPPGPAGPPGNPGTAGAASTISLIVQGSADFEKSAPIPNSEAAPLCTLSKIVLRRYAPRADRSCELAPGAQRGEPWRITVDGAVCGVTCFNISEKK